MKTEINNIEVYFGCSDILGVKHWGANILYHQYRLRFDFDESGLSNSSPQIKLDQKLLVSVVKHVLDNIDAIKSKTTVLFTELHNQAYSNQTIADYKGYFQPESIELKRVINWGDSNSDRVPYFEYEVGYLLDSEIDTILIEPHHSYYARFSNHNGLTLTGVHRV